MRFRSLLRALYAAPLIWLLAHAPGARASVLVPVSAEEMVARAERVVVGTVEGQQSRWADLGHTVIVTDVRVRVTRGMRGAKDGEVITVRHLGGTVDEIGMRVYGEARYAAGEEVLLFLERRGAAYFSVGMTQGKLHITPADDKNPRRVHADLQGAELLQSGRPVAPTGPRPLDDVLREVSALIQRIPPRTQAVRP